jgi:hypothetical protein
MLLTNLKLIVILTERHNHIFIGVKPQNKAIIVTDHLSH